MFKLLKIRILYFFLLGTIIFVSCDGRDRKLRTNTEGFTSSKLLPSFSNQIKYIPELPVRIVTDTIFNNGFHVKLDYHSITNAKTVNQVIDKNDTRVYYSDFEAIVRVCKNDALCSQIKIDKNLFKDFETVENFQNAIMQFVWIDQESSANNRIYLNTSFKSIETNAFKDFVITIDYKGTIQIFEKTILQKTV